jgi:DNA-binding ferritin-like protein
MSDTTDSKLEERVKISEAAHRADLAEHRKAYSEAVDAQLREWDTHLDDLGETVDALYGASRNRLQDEMRDTRRQRDAAAKRAAEAREAPGERWRELKDDVAAQFQKLEQKADAVAEKVRAKKK